MKKYVSLFMSLFVVASLHANIRGDYEVLGDIPKKGSKKIVKFEEFLNFGCPHCNNLRNLSKNFRKSYKNKVDFVDVPITFSGQSDAPIRLYYVAKSKGRGEEVKNALFDTHHKFGVNVFNPGTVNYLARTLGLADAYRKEANAAWIDDQIAKNNALANQYGVRGTPTVVIEGVLKMNIRSMASFVRMLPNTIEDLLQR